MVRTVNNTRWAYIHMYMCVYIYVYCMRPPLDGFLGPGCCEVVSGSPEFLGITPSVNGLCLCELFAKRCVESAEPLYGRGAARTIPQQTPNPKPHQWPHVGLYSDTTSHLLPLLSLRTHNPS